MMTTSYPNHAGMHPQGMPHGQPMAGPGPNPGHPMAQMQMHPGVSGPNGPVSQAGPMMGGMQPGVGPSAHALSHLQPQQAAAAQMFHNQQQQQHMQMNPALLQQRQNQQQQHQAYLRQQQQQMLAQQQNAGMGMAFPQNMAGMNAQQLAAMQAGNMGGQPFVQLPEHLRHQLAAQQQQQLQRQQQQQATGNPQAQAHAMAQAQAQAQAQAHAQAQAQAQAQHAQQQQQMQAQAIAMQHAQSQSSNHSASGPPGPPTTTQPQQAPLRPPSAIGSHQGQASPAPQPTPQQTQQQQQGPQPQQQTAPNQPQNAPQQQNQPSQNQQMQQQRTQVIAQTQQAQVQAQAQQAAAARMNMMKHSGATAQQNSGPIVGGGAIIKLLNLADKMGRFHRSQGPDVNSIAHWEAFVEHFFAPSGSFIHSIFSMYPTEKRKQFDIIYTSMPRYFYTQFNTELENLQITLDGAQEKTIPTPTSTETKVFCDRAKFIYSYSNNTQVVVRGKLTAFWAGSEKIEWLQFEMEDHQQYLLRSAVEALFTQPSPSQLSQTQSPRLNKSSKQRQQQQRQIKQESEKAEPTLFMSKLPQAPITDFGLPHALQHYLETYEGFYNMTNLMAHSQEHPNLSANQALSSWVEVMSASSGMAQPQGAGNPMQRGQNPQGMQQQQILPPGARTPSGTGQPGAPQFMSPAMQNSLLPNAVNGSPHLMQHHTPSPASHAMAAQHSQQGTNSSATASVNTSPNVSQKRRRSTAKVEPDDDNINGAQKVKPSPRVPNKRMKGNNG